MTKPTLFLLHFAGGNCFSYRFLKPYLSDYECVPVELPGRGRRHQEFLLTDFEQAANDIYQQLMSRINTPDFLIFGHSMGALLALKVTAMLERNGVFPMGVIVGGSAGPGTKKEKRHLLPKTQLKDYLQKMGGFPDEVLAEDDLFNYFFPIIQADFRIAEVNYPENFPTIKSPLHVVMGHMEKEVTDINNWRFFATGPLKTTILKGGHFFIHQCAEELASIIRALNSERNHHRASIAM